MSDLQVTDLASERLSQTRQHQHFLSKHFTKGTLIVALWSFDPPLQVSNIPIRLEAPDRHSLNFEVVGFRSVAPSNSST